MKNYKLLLKPCWNYKDIMAYCECKTTKAYEIMERVRKTYKGGIKGEPRLVKRNSVLAYLDTDIDLELRIYECFKKGGNNGERL